MVAATMSWSLFPIQSSNSPAAPHEAEVSTAWLDIIECMDGSLQSNHSSVALVPCDCGVSRRLGSLQRGRHAWMYGGQVGHGLANRAAPRLRNSRTQSSTLAVGCSWLKRGMQGRDGRAFHPVSSIRLHNVTAVSLPGQRVAWGHRRTG